MAKQRKKYNKFKSASIAAKRGLQNLAIICKTLGDDTGWFYINTKTGNVVPRSKSLDFAAAKLRHQWGIITAATGFESKGTPCCKINDIKLMNEEPHGTMTAYVQEDLKELYKSMKGKTVCNAVWIAIPNGDELPESQVEFLLDKVGAWS